MGKSKNPMEWVTKVLKDVEEADIGAAESIAVLERGRIQLLLDRDEVADIHKVILTIQPDLLITDDFAGDNMHKWGCYLSVDPKADTIFLFEANTANLEDRNIFAYSFWTWYEDFVATIGNQQNQMVLPEMSKVHDFLDPITVGGDIGFVAKNSITTVAQKLNGNFLATVYFRRRRSRNEKANLVMLRA